MICSTVSSTINPISLTKSNFTSDWLALPNILSNCCNRLSTLQEQACEDDDNNDDLLYVNTWSFLHRTLLLVPVGLPPASSPAAKNKHKIY